MRPKPKPREPRAPGLRRSRGGCDGTSRSAAQPVPNVRHRARRRPRDRLCPLRRDQRRVASRTRTVRWPSRSTGLTTNDAAPTGQPNSPAPADDAAPAAGNAATIEASAASGSRQAAHGTSGTGWPASTAATAPTASRCADDATAAKATGCGAPSGSRSHRAKTGGEPEPIDPGDGCNRPGAMADCEGVDMETLRARVRHYEAHRRWKIKQRARATPGGSKSL